MASKLFATAALKKYRESKGYTQQEMVGLLAIEMDIDLSFSTYQKWEQGTLPLTPDNALMISRFTKIDVRELLQRKEPVSEQG